MLSTQEIVQLRDVAVAAVTAAGEMVLSKIGDDFAVSTKGPAADDNVVSEIDLASQKVIFSVLRGSFPDYAIVSEEDTDFKTVATDIIWSVDPIDGTRNFICGAPEFAISVAALWRGRTVAGAIWTPWHSQSGYRICHAAYGMGAWSGTRRLSITDLADGIPTRRRHAFFPTMNRNAYAMSPELQRAPGEIRVIGCACWEMLGLAHNTAHYFATGMCAHWDIAAGSLLVTEAGGVLLTADAEGRLVPFVMPGATDYQNDVATFAMLQEWKGVLVGAPPNVARHLQQHLTFIRD